jgi:diacylglycerol kinase (ATP)
MGGIDGWSAPVDRWLRATVNTWNGLRAAARSEAAFREELVALALAIPLAFFVTSDNWKRLLLVLVVLLILVVELLNTAVEKLGDVVSKGPHPAIKDIKDMGSAAVAVSLVMAGLVWLAAVAERLGFW